MSDRPNDDVPPPDSDATKPQPETHRPSRSIGPYRLLQLVGEGGMGEVWLAEQTHPVRRQVALKVIKAGMDTALVVNRFEAEPQALALVDHPAMRRPDQMELTSLDVDTRIDVCALGILLCQPQMGALPFDGKTRGSCEVRSNEETRYALGSACLTLVAGDAGGSV